MVQMNDVKKVVLLTTLGLCDAIRSKVVSTDEAEQFLFSPHTMRLLNHDTELQEIIHLCTEFGSIARLVPNALDAAIADVKTRAEVLLAKMPPYDYHQEAWLHRLL